MVSDKRKKFHRGHLERDRDILIGVHHDHVIFPSGCLQIGSSVVSRHLHGVRERKIFQRKICDSAVNFHAFHGRIVKIFYTLLRVGPGSHAEYKDFCRIFFRDAGHERSGQRVIIVHAGQGIVFCHDGLHTEENIGGENHAAVCFPDLQIIVN